MISFQSLGIVLLIALIVFGPKRLPEIGKALGKGIHEFKEGATDEDKKDQNKAEMQNITPQPQQPQQLSQSQQAPQQPAAPQKDEVKKQ